MSDRIRIVRSNDSHIDGIYEIEKSVFAVPWSKKALYEDIVENILSYYVTALSEKEKRVVGYGGMWLVQDEAHVTNIAVDKAFQGKGVGSAILEALIRKCEISGIRYMTQRLYQKFGFKAEGIRKGYYSDNKKDAIIMWKYL
jgi:ribosomal-protein-alanine N-acetyltransferase